MQFLTGLFGGTGNTLVTAILALGIVLVLIVMCVWVLKFAFRASSNVGRARHRRLTLVDSVAVDAKRRLVIVRS
jgi:flagellar protein FliO/FliZ